MSKKNFQPHKNLGFYLHAKKATNALATPMKPHVAPVKQTKMDTPKAPVVMKPQKMKTGRGKH